MKLAILAGETSGDNYGALLIESIKNLSPDTFIAGTGGSRMREKLNLSIEGLPYGKMGFSGVFGNLPLFYRSFRKIKKEVERLKPDIVVFIDNPGFNLKMARALGRKFSCCYYIPPKIWAHNYGRIRTIKEYIRAVIPVFDFEEEIYRKEGVPCRWFGHPAVDLLLKVQAEKVEKHHDGGKVPVVGLLPGSRQEEIASLLPAFIHIANLLKQKIQFEIMLSAADSDIRRSEEFILKKHGVKLNIIEGPPYKVIDNSDLLLAACGTVNLEVALAGKPLLVFYKTSVLNYVLAKMMVKLKLFSPVNLLYGKKIVPEYIQNFSYARVVDDCLDILNRGELYARQTESFRTFRSKTGDGGVSARAAELILGLAK